MNRFAANTDPAPVDIQSKSDASPTPAHSRSGVRLNILCNFIDPTQPDVGRKWDNLVKSSTEGSIFHTSAWAKVLAETYHYRPTYFILHCRGGGSILLPMMDVRSYMTGSRGISLPFTDFCESLVLEPYDPLEMLEQTIGFAQRCGWKSMELRGCNGIDAVHSASYYEHILNLVADDEEMFGKLSGASRRNVRKAIREGVAVAILNTTEAVRRYYELHCITRKRHGKPPQPYSFFASIHRHIIEEGNGFIALAHHDGIDIAGGVFLHFGTRAVFKFGASRYSHRHLRANNLVMWEAIRALGARGIQRLCFGRTDLRHEGLRRFKLGFGPEERIVHYYKFDTRKQAFVGGYSRARMPYERIFKHVPAPVLNMAGRVFYKHIG